MTIFATVTSTPILKNSKNVNAFTFLDSATSIIIILLAAPSIVRFPAMVLADANIIHWLMCRLPPNPLFNITRLYNATKGTLLSIWLNKILIVDIIALL